MRAADVVLTEEQGAILRGWLGAGKTEQRMAFRAEVILAIAEGLSNQAVAERLGTRPATVSKWRAALRGRVSRVCATRRAAASPGSTRATMSGASWRFWMSRRRRGTGAGTAACWPGMGDISKHQIWRVLRRHEISLARQRSWRISTDPGFAPTAADIAGLYLQPPENAMVFAVDEQPHIQALELRIPVIVIGHSGRR